MKISLTVLRLQRGHNFQTDNFRGAEGDNSVKHIGGVSIFVLCTLSADGLHLYQVS